MNNINFQGHFITNTQIKELSNKKYVPLDVAFVELEPHNKNDLNTLYEIKDEWNGLFEYLIYNYAFESSIIKNNRQFYALTTQKNSFELMDYKKILGIVQFNKTDTTNEIEFIQTNPLYITKSRNFFQKFFKKKTYKKIGSAMVNSLKNLSDKSIKLYSIKNAEEFYKKLGFIKKYPDKNIYFWNKSSS